MSLTTALSPSHLISAYGLLGIVAIVFAETGLFIGFFLPGDSLLFLAGAYAATSKAGVHLMLAPLLISVTLAAIVGAQTGFVIGRLLGSQFLDRPDHRVIKKKYIDQSREALSKYGEFKAVLLARVIPIVRTFINPLVGALGMKPQRFLAANILGGVVWAVGVTLLGYGLGSAINIDKYILPLTAVIVALSLIPVIKGVRDHKH